MKSIKLNASQVKSTLAGRKTQHRIVVKAFESSNGEKAIHVKDHNNNKCGWVSCKMMSEQPSIAHSFCPLGKVGDKIFVKEDFIIYQLINYVRRQSGAAFSEIGDGSVAYEADGYGTVQEFKEHAMICFNEDEMGRDDGLEAVEVEGDNWKSAHYMKQEQSRITLEITDITIERLNDISEDDCTAEGITPKSYLEWWKKPKFERLWNSIHKEPSKQWHSNPWVWVITFKKI